jgi:DNA-binding transcriptional ArsR family regulator
MRQEEQDKRHGTEISKIQPKGRESHSQDFVLEKSIFNNIFEKDIRRVFIYKKAERLAKAVQLIAPAFSGSASLKNRIDAIAIGIIDAALLPPRQMSAALPRELLALSSTLSLAQTSGVLSAMNAEILIKESHLLLQEAALYEDPRISFDEVSTLSDIAKNTLSKVSTKATNTVRQRPEAHEHVKDIKDKKTHIKDRREAVLSVIKDKGKASIKDISTLIRGVSEKTIQRELMELINEGMVLKQGERRWSTYSLV